jgi:hypothetical protein
MVAICMRRQALPQKVMPEWEETCAVACAVQNLWLAATAHGIAGGVPDRHVKDLCRLALPMAKCRLALLLLSTIALFLLA